MKTFLSLLISLLLVVPLRSQDCETYFPMKSGAEFVITSYNAKDKQDATATHKVFNVNTNDGVTLVDVRTTVEAKKGDPIEYEYQVQCDGDNLTLNHFSGIASEQLAMGDITIEGDYLEIPRNPEAGQQLPDAMLKFSFGGSDMPMAMSMNIKIINRVAEGYEEITTPAGTFNALKISYEVETKMVMTVRGKGVEWFAEGVGMVRTESYNNKGKLQGYSVLTSITGN